MQGNKQQTTDQNVVQDNNQAEITESACVNNSQDVYNDADAVDNVGNNEEGVEENIEKNEIDFGYLIIEFMNEINQKLAFWEDENKRKNTIIDNMHKELTDYRNGAIDKQSESLIMEIIHLIDSNNKVLHILEQEENQEEITKKALVQIRGLSLDLEDILYRHNIEKYENPSIEVDVSRQTVVEYDLTDDNNLVNKVSRRISPGYDKDGKIVRKEKISIYKIGGKNIE